MVDQREPVRRVLVVDDEPRNLNLVEALLSTEGVEVVRAGGGREGIDRFRQAVPTGGFDLVLLDVMMPEVDGFAALGEMRRATPAGERIPICLVTALGAREDRLRGLEAGADDFLTKPLDPSELRCRVRTFLSLRGAQRALRARADELEALHRAKAELSRMLVHDLKNPLAGVGSNLGWIERRLGKKGLEDPDLFAALADARSSADRLVGLVGGLIDIEKAETGQLVVRKRVVKAAELLDGLRRRHEREAEERGLRFSIKIGAGRTEATEAGETEAGVELELDPDLVTRVLENLIENAIRYTPTGGAIEVSASTSSAGAELAVGNSGAAIPEAQRAAIFEKHASGEDRGARGRNLGLGLYFCKLAAEAHEGSIRCESTERWPTRFVLRLPTRRPAPAAEPRRAAAFLD
jgi:signal transduction histidine kinase